MDIKILPKVHLHLHLEGSIQPLTLLDLYTKQTKFQDKLTVDKITKNMQMTDDCNSFKDFLDKFEFIFGCNFTPQALKRITYEAIANANAEGVCYLELRFCPHSLKARSGVDIPEAIESISEGLVIGMLDFPDVVGSLIIIIDQQLGLNKALEAVRWATIYKKEGITGIDIASDPTKIPLIDYLPVCKLVHDEGFGLTVHAGEFEDSESVRVAVEQLGASRIGHGIRCIEDPDVMDLLIKKQIMLEISVTSNICTKVIPSIGLHPLPELMDAGIRVTLNTDDPTIFDTTLIKEYNLVKEAFEITIEDFKQMNLDGIDSAFVDQKQRKEIRMKIEKGFDAIMD